MRQQGTANDDAYQVLFPLTLLSWQAVGPLRKQAQALGASPGQS